MTSPRATAARAKHHRFSTNRVLDARRRTHASPAAGTRGPPVVVFVRVVGAVVDVGRRRLRRSRTGPGTVQKHELDLHRGVLGEPGHAHAGHGGSVSTRCVRRRSSGRRRAFFVAFLFFRVDGSRDSHPRLSRPRATGRVQLRDPPVAPRHRLYASSAARGPALASGSAREPTTVPRRDHGVARPSRFPRRAPPPPRCARRAAPASSRRVLPPIERVVGSIPMLPARDAEPAPGRRLRVRADTCRRPARERLHVQRPPGRRAFRRAFRRVIPAQRGGGTLFTVALQWPRGRPRAGGLDRRARAGGECVGTTRTYAAFTAAGWCSCPARRAARSRRPAKISRTHRRAPRRPAERRLRRRGGGGRRVIGVRSGSPRTSRRPSASPSVGLGRRRESRPARARPPPPPPRRGARRAARAGPRAGVDHLAGRDFARRAWRRRRRRRARSAGPDGAYGSGDVTTISGTGGPSMLSFARLKSGQSSTSVSNSPTFARAVAPERALDFAQRLPRVRRGSLRGASSARGPSPPP